MHRGALRWRATLLILGTIIGAGIFGIPAMVGLWGVIPSICAFLFIGGIVLCAHLYFAEGLLANTDHGRFAGQSKYWLGGTAGYLGGTLQSLQIFGSNLAYIILGGEFTRAFLELFGISVPLLALQILFWAVGACIVFFGIERVSRAEVYLTWSLIGIILIIVGVGLLQDNPLSLRYAFSSSWNGFEPYGVFLFSLMGISALPEAAELVEYRRKDLFQVIIRSMIMAIALTCGYGIVAWSASHGTLGRDPSDVIRFLPTWLAYIVPLFGFVAVMTSYISSALDLRNLFRHDYHIPSVLAWSIALGIPFVLLFLTSRDFMSTIGFVGSIFAASLGMMSALIGYKALQKKKGQPSTFFEKVWRNVLPFVVIAFFIFGGALWVLVN